jgi:hypothetical protein
MVDTSMIAAGFILGQEADNGCFHPACYGSRPMNERESRHSQAKLELYGLFIALNMWRIYLSCVQFTVFMDAQYVIGMLKSFDPLPSAAENCWKAGIKMFDMKIEHKPAAQMKAADALSCQSPTSKEMEALRILEQKEELESEWSENIGLLIHAPFPIKRRAYYQGTNCYKLWPHVSPLCTFPRLEMWTDFLVYVRASDLVMWPDIRIAYSSS